MTEIFYGGRLCYVGSKCGIIQNLPYPANLIYVAFGNVDESYIETEMFKEKFGEVMQWVSDRQQKVIECRYVNGLSYFRNHSI